MNKTGSIGIAILVIAIIIGVVYAMSSSIPSEENLPIVDEGNLPIVDEENLPIVDEEIISEDIEHTGTDFSVELTEKIGLKSP